MDKPNDEPMCDLLTQGIQVYEKTAWTPRSLLEKNPRQLVEKISSGPPLADLKLFDSAISLLQVILGAPHGDSGIDAGEF
jgi:hypothetical protein